MKLWTRGAIDALEVELKALQTALINQADAHTATIMPGFTHLQVAHQTFGHHLLAYVETIGRGPQPAPRLPRAFERVSLGAAALAEPRFRSTGTQPRKRLGSTGPPRTRSMPCPIGISPWSFWVRRRSVPRTCPGWRRNW